MKSINVLPIIFIVLVLGLLNLAHAGSTKQVWEGTMEQANYKPFPVKITLSDFKPGQVCGRIEHSSFNCSGNLKCLAFAQNTYVLEQTIDIGKERCLNGINLLFLNSDSTMTRIWIRPNTGLEGARGTLKLRK